MKEYKSFYKQVRGIDCKEITVCDDETEAYNYWQENVNHNKNDCCNLRR